jgi:hypothetical protein
MFFAIKFVFPSLYKIEPKTRLKSNFGVGRLYKEVA